jgi:6-phosphogluconolactonase (cycloisomerase 2 family)
MFISLKAIIRSFAILPALTILTAAAASAQLSVVNVANERDDPLGDANDVELVEVDGTVFAYVPGISGDGLTYFSVASDGTLTHLGFVYDDATLELDGASAVTSAVVDSTPYLFVGGSTDSGISVFSIAADGALTNVDNVADGGALKLGGVSDLTVRMVAGTVYIFASGSTDDGVSVFSVANDGTLTNVHNESRSGANQLDGASALTTAVIGTTAFLFVTGATDDGLSIFSIADNGSLSLTASIADNATYELDGAYAVTTAVVDSTTYVFAGGQTDRGFSVFSVSDVGFASNVDNVSDDATLKLGLTRALTTTVVDGTTYLYVNGASDDGISSFSVANDGTVTNVENISDDATVNLNGAIAGRAITIGGTDYYITAAGTDRGVSVFSIANDGTLTNTDNASATTVTLLYQPIGMTSTTVDGTPYLYVTSYGDDGINGYSVADDGSLTLVDLVADDGTLNLDGAQPIGAVEVDGSTFLVAGSLDDDGLSSFSIANDGTLTNVDNEADTGSVYLDGVNALSFAEVDGTSYVFTTASFRDDGVSVYSIASNGSLTNVANVGESGSVALLDPVSSTTAEIDGTTYLFVASTGEDAIAVFSIASNGALTHVGDTVDDGTLNLDGASSVTTAVIDGTTYLFATGNVDNGISVFSVAAGGSLSNVDNVSDAGLLELYYPYWISAFAMDGTTYVVATAIQDDGFSLFSVGDDGTLTNVANQSDNSTLNLDNARQGAIVDAGGETYLYVPGFSDHGFSGFAFNFPPQVVSIERETPATSPTGDDSVTWRVTFSEDVQNVSADDFSASGTTGTLAINNVSATVTDVTLSGGDMADLNGTVTLEFAGGQDIADLVGTAMSDTTPTGANDNTFLIDNSAPRIASIVRDTPASSPTAADSVTWRVTFDEAVANVTADDFSVSGTTGTLSINTVSTSVTDVIVSGGDMASLDGTITLGFAGGQDIADLLGNALANITPTGANDDTFVIDNTMPGLAISGPAGPVTGAFTATFTFDEDVTGFASDDITVGNGAASDFQATSASVYTATITPAADGAVTVDVAGAAAQDAAGNDNSAAIQLAVTNDQSSPSVSITGPSGPVSGAFTATFTFSEDVTGFAADDITVGNGAASNVQATSASVYTATITPAADGAVTVDVAGAAAQDAAGNPSQAAAQFFVENDETAPTLAITGPSGPVSGAFTATFTFSEDVTGFAADDITVGNGAASDFQATSASVYTATITPAADGAVTVDVAGAAAQDAAGNDNSAAIQLAVTNDQSSPSVSITGPSGPVSGAFTATFTFSEDVTGFAADDITVGNGAASNVQATSASVYTATITPAADGAVTVDVAGAAAQDAAGNPSQAAAQFFVENDETAPTVSAILRQTPAVAPTDADSLVWRVTFAEAVNNVDAGDFSVTGTSAAVESVADAGSNAFDVTVSGGDLADLNGMATLDFAGGQDIADAAGNTLSDTTPTGSDERTWSVINDADAPAVTSIVRDDPATELTNADTLVWAVAFSEDVTDIDAADFAVSGTTGSVTDVSPQAVALPPSVNASAHSSAFAVSSAHFVITASGGDLASFDGDVVLSFAADQDITDDAGNALTNTSPVGANEASYTLDNTAPTVALTTSAESPVSGPFTLTATFSEDVTGFDISDLSVGDGAASDFEAVSGTVYTFLVTPGSAASITIDIPVGAAADEAGNDSPAAAQFSIVHDTDRTLTVSLPGVGAGVVTSSMTGIDCGIDCSEDYTLGTSVTLTASAETGSTFAGWTAGSCTGTSTADCAVTVDADISVAARFTLDTPPPGRIVASTLPAARSGYVGGPVITAFLSVVSRTTSPAQSCQVSAPTGAPVTLSYRQINGDGAAIGANNPLFDIAPGGALSFVIAMTPTEETDAGGYEFLPVITCENASLDPIVGVNSVFLTIESLPTPDILSISATPSNDGVIRIPAPGATGFMAAAAVNIGAGDGSAEPGEITLVASVDTGAANLPVTAEVCQIDQVTAACLTPRGPSVTLTAAQNSPIFYAVFVRDTSTGGIAFDPANARVFLRFADASGTIRSATSAAVTAPAPAAAAEIASALPEGRWSVLVRQPEGVWPGLARASLFVMADGTAVMDDGRTVRRLDIAPVSSDTEGRGAFEALQLEGQWSTDGAIRLGAPWADKRGEFWGARDTRTARVVDWTTYSGSYGAGVYLTEAGEIRGSLLGCGVYGRAGAGFNTPLTLSGCDHAGAYTAILDVPSNDNGAPALLVAGQEEGWRLER